jgi:hypothetical protein
MLTSTAYTSHSARTAAQQRIDEATALLRNADKQTMLVDAGQHQQMLASA